MPPNSDPTSTRWKLAWTAQPPPDIPLPGGISRSFIQTPNGPLELLSARPATGSYETASGPTDPAFTAPVLFIHGGFGCAQVYSDFMVRLASHGYTCHALSLRGHGWSWNPGYLRMVFMTTATALAEDIAAGVNHLEKEGIKRGGGLVVESERRGWGKGDVVLVGHSDGGGLVQVACDRELVKVKALVLLSGTPSFGGWEVYKHWWLSLDPWFMPRVCLRDFMHPRSALSSTQFVKNAFFAPSIPLSTVRAFEPLLSEYESLLWPVQIMRKGYVDCHRVLLNCGLKMLQLGAEHDRLNRIDLVERSAAEYTIALGELTRDMGKEWIERKSQGRACVDFDEVEGSGHQMMNDSKWEDAVDILEEWFDILGEDNEEPVEGGGVDGRGDIRDT